MRKKRKKIILILQSFLLIFILISGCTQNQTNNLNEQTKMGTTDNSNLSIVTTIFPQYDFVRQIAGDQVDLHLLLKPGAESHSYEPTPQDIKLIQASDLFIYVGGENDSWVEGILESMQDEAPKTMQLLELVDTLEEEIVEGMEHADHPEDQTHAHQVDEHVWTSPIKAIEIVKKISKQLSDQDPVNAEIYQKNSDEYIAELEELDEKFEKLVKDTNRNIILFGDRFPFRYLVEEYGIDYYAAFTGCSTDTEASAATVAFLIDKTNELQLPYVFSIEFSNEEIANSIAEATDAEKLTLHSIHNVSKEDLESGETYISLMEKNLENLTKALK